MDHEPSGKREQVFQRRPGPLLVRALPPGRRFTIKVNIRTLGKCTQIRILESFRFLQTNRRNRRGAFHSSGGLLFTSLGRGPGLRNFLALALRLSDSRSLTDASTKSL